MLNNSLVYCFLLFFFSSSLEGCFFEFFCSFFSKGTPKPCYLSQLPVDAQNIIAKYLIKYELEKKFEKKFLKDYELNAAKGVIVVVEYGIALGSCVLSNKTEEDYKSANIKDFTIVRDRIIGLQVFSKIINHNTVQSSRLLVKKLESSEKVKVVDIQQDESVEAFTISPNGAHVFAIAKTDNNEQKLLMFDWNQDSLQKQSFDIKKDMYKEIGYFPQCNGIALLTTSGKLEFKYLDEDTNKNLLEGYLRTKGVCKLLKDSSFQ